MTYPELLEFHGWRVDVVVINPSKAIRASRRDEVYLDAFGGDVEIALHSILYEHLLPAKLHRLGTASVTEPPDEIR